MASKTKTKAGTWNPIPSPASKSKKYVSLMSEPPTEKAIQNKEIEIANTSFVEGIPIPLVSKITDLSIEEVQQIADELMDDNQ